MSREENSPSTGISQTLQETLADVLQVIPIPVSMGANKVMLKIREHQGSIHVGPAHLVNARGEVRAIEVLGFPTIEVASPEAIAPGVSTIRVQGATGDEASHYPWLVQE